MTDTYHIDDFEIEINLNPALHEHLLRVKMVENFIRCKKRCFKQHIMGMYTRKLMTRGTRGPIKLKQNYTFNI